MGGSVAYLVRHGATAWSLSGQHTSSTDLALEESGRIEARALGAVLARHPFALVLSSPLRRALETAELAGFGDRLEITDDLREWDYGDCEGRTTAEIRGDQPGWTLFADGVPNGETAVQVQARARRIVERIRRTEGDTVCFAHGHILRVVAATWMGLGPEAGAHLGLDAGSLSVLGWERETPVLSLWNSRPH
jgi:broad specificity phosphatase PhoE